ncbi:MAG: hypothetical protein CR967_04990 [Proteobacteria bacterium]|nr:MAG: hypothetical protein CR967_04990 [Pseudomonadota bacterium]
MLEKTQEKLGVLLKKVCNLFDLDLKITLTFDLKGTCTIGQCRKIKNGYLIRLHKPLLEKYKQTYLNDVLTHELAHAIQMELYKTKTKPHGKEWKAIMEKLENSPYNPQKRPKYEIPKKNLFPKKYFPYTCKCNTPHKLSQTRHNRAKKGTKYICKKCKSFLVYVK